MTERRQPKVIIYGREKCPFTRRAREAYGRKAEFRDVETDPANLKEMLSLGQGSRRIPLIVRDGVPEIGFEGRS
ncbi:UXX-star (seleno)protein family 1 [Desulfovibrio aminophilus]|uniref:UXX-star selenoprotein family 1 n=1 Tax=Desulfovibrio aminophilus TaxID=81425 RepID=UPI00339313F5